MLADSVQDVSNILNDFIGVTVKYRMEDNRIMIFTFDKDNRGRELPVFQAYYYDDDSSMVVVSKEPGTIDIDFINSMIYKVKNNENNENNVNTIRD